MHTKRDLLLPKLPERAILASQQPLGSYSTSTPLAGNFRRLVLADEGHLGLLRLRRIREYADERRGAEKQAIGDAFQGALSLGWRMRGSGFCLGAAEPFI
jgi:hypothetical protein